MDPTSGRLHTLAVAACVAWMAAGAARALELRAWPVDPLIKVLGDAKPPSRPERAVRIAAARGEYEAGQVAFRADAPVRRLTVAASPLVNAATRAKLDDVEANFLNVHKLDRATPPVVEGETCVTPPALVPDAFSTDATLALEPNVTRSAWITVHVPEAAAPGTYRGTVDLDADGTRASVPIELEVHAAVVPRKRSLKIYNWLFYDKEKGWGNLRHRLGGDPWDERDWNTLRAIAANMVAHRQNLFTLPLVHNVLSGPGIFSVRTIKDGGSYRFDFSLFDRCAEIFLAEDPEGILVGGYLAVFGATGRTLDARGNVALRSPRIQLWDPKTNQAAGVLDSVDADDPAYRAFLRALMPALQKHLEQKGWLGNFMMSLHDETFPQYAKARVELARFVRALAPKIRFVDANRNVDQAGSIHVWFPLPHHFEAFRDFYTERQAEGDEVGFYTCVTPAGYHMNRFVSMPLIKTRLLHWYNYKCGLTGFLHWGYNAKLPPADAEAIVMDGDANLVYKDTVGCPVPSIRQEAMRDGIEDYELLKLAESRHKTLARRLCDHLVTDCRRYTRDVGEFRRTRGLLLQLASAEHVAPKLASAIGALPTDHGWLLRDLPPAPPSKKGWKLVFSDDFERAELGESWIQPVGKWTIRNGAAAMTRKGDGALLYAKPLAPDQRIEFDAWTARGYPCDLSGLLCADPAEGRGFASAYFFGYGCEMNAFSKLLIRGVQYRVYPVRITPGKKAHIICEREGDRLSHWVDGVPILHCRHRDRLDGPKHRHAGVYMYLPDQFVDNVRVYAR